MGVLKRIWGFPNFQEAYGGSESEVGHPNFQSLYRESNSRGILVGCQAIGGEWPTPGEYWALTIKV